MLPLSMLTKLTANRAVKIDTNFLLYYYSTHDYIFIEARKPTEIDG